MRWRLSDRFDPAAVPLADRHYSRRTPGSPQFVPPGRCLVLLTEHADALWVTSWPLPEFTRHRWAGAWVCTLFRNEGPALSSDLIRDAVAATCWKYGTPPDGGMVTFVDTRKVRPKRDPGRCFLRAGFKRDGFTQGGLVALRLEPEAMPTPQAPIHAQGAMLA